MKSKLGKLFVTTLLATLPVTHAQGILTGSEELKLDFDDAAETISQISAATNPLAKHLDKGIKALNATLAKVKADPNALNKSEFELAFAGNIGRVIRDMDDVMTIRDQTMWAFEDITQEVVRVAKRLEYNHTHAKERVARKQEALVKLKKEMTELAREIERKGAKASEASKRKFKQLLRRYRMDERTLRNLTAMEKQLNRTLTVLGKNGSCIEQGAKNLASWFDNLKSNRSAFRELAESRKDMANLATMMTAGGSYSLFSTFEKLRGIQTKLQAFNTTFDAMGENLDTLQSFDATAMDLAPVEETDNAEPWKQWLSEQE